jgi:hypothetical protein
VYFALIKPHLTPHNSDPPFTVANSATYRPRNTRLAFGVWAPWSRRRAASAFTCVPFHRTYTRF